MNNNNQIKTVLVADIELTMEPESDRQYHNINKVFINNAPDTNALLREVDELDVPTDWIDEANDDIQSFVSDQWECTETSIRTKEVALDDLTSEQMVTFLASNPQLTLKRVDGEQVSFKTKDTYYLEQTESKIDNLQNSYEKAKVIDAFVDDKQVVNS